METSLYKFFFYLQWKQWLEKVSLFHCFCRAAGSKHFLKGKPVFQSHMKSNVLKLFKQETPCFQFTRPSFNQVIPFSFPSLEVCGFRSNIFILGITFIIIIIFNGKKKQKTPKQSKQQQQKKQPTKKHQARVRIQSLCFSTSKYFSMAEVNICYRSKEMVHFGSHSLHTEGLSSLSQEILDVPSDFNLYIKASCETVYIHWNAQTATGSWVALPSSCLISEKKV